MENEASAPKRDDGLTELETAYLRAIVAGESQPLIAEKLELSDDKAQQVRHSMMMKLGAITTADAVRIGIYAGL